MSTKAISRPGLPRADVLMTLVLVGLMIGMDVVALIIGISRPGRWPALLIMPGTIGLVAACYAISLRTPSFCLKARGTDGALVASVFMGKTLVMMAITLTVFHAGLLGFETGLVDRSIGDGFERVFVGALGANLIFMGNSMAKVMTSRVSTAPKSRFHAWGTVLTGVGLVLAAVVAPEDQMTPIVVTLAMIPLFTGLGMVLIKMTRRSAG